MEYWKETAWNAAEKIAKSGKHERRKWKRQGEWDAEHYKTVSTHLSIEDSNELRRICHIEGVSRYHLLQYLIDKFISEWRMNHAY